MKSIATLALGECTRDHIAGITEGLAETHRECLDCAQGMRAVAGGSEPDKIFAANDGDVPRPRAPVDGHHLNRSGGASRPKRCPTCWGCRCCCPPQR